MASNNLGTIKQDYQILGVCLKGTAAQVTSSFLLPVWEKGVGRNRGLMQINTWLSGWWYGWDFGLYGLRMLFDDYNLLGRDGIHLTRNGRRIFVNWLESVVKWALNRGMGPIVVKLKATGWRGKKKKKARQWLLLSHLRTGRGWKSIQQQKWSLMP